MLEAHRAGASDDPLAERPAVIARVSGATSERAGVWYGDGGSLDMARHGTRRTPPARREMDVSGLVRRRRAGPRVCVSNNAVVDARPSHKRRARALLDVCVSDNIENGDVC